MNIQELKQYTANKKKLQTEEWKKVIEMTGHCSPLTELEFVEVSKVHSIKSRTHRSHSKGNLWSYKNTDDREQFKK